MKVSNMKKVLLAIGLGFGISGALPVAYAYPSGATCADLKTQCEAGNQNACQSYQTYDCALCEWFPEDCKYTGPFGGN